MGRGLSVPKFWLCTLNSPSDPVLKAELLKYMEFQADARAMEWYGPVFRQRVFTMLLVLKRLNVAANKDIRKLLAKYMSKVEHIYVPQKLKK